MDLLSDPITERRSDQDNPNMALVYRLGANVLSAAKVVSSVYTAVSTTVDRQLPYTTRYQTWGDALLNASQELSDMGDGRLGRKARSYGRMISRFSSMMDDVGDKIGYHTKSIGRIVRDTKNASTGVDRMIAIANVAPQAVTFGRDVAMTYRRITSPPQVDVSARKSGKIKAGLMSFESVIGASPLSKHRKVRIGLFAFKCFNTFYSIKSFLAERKDHKEQAAQLLRHQGGVATEG